MRLRQIVICFCAFCLCAMAISNGFSAYAQSSVRIKAGGFGADSVPSWSVYIAQEKMFLAREGIQFDFARSYDQMRGLIGGSFDIIVDGASTTTLAAGRNTDIVIVYDLGRSDCATPGFRGRSAPFCPEVSSAIGGKNE